MAPLLEAEGVTKVFGGLTAVDLFQLHDRALPPGEGIDHV